MGEMIQKGKGDRSEEEEEVKGRDLPGMVQILRSRSPDVLGCVAADGWSRTLGPLFTFVAGLTTL